MPAVTKKTATRKTTTKKKTSSRAASKRATSSGTAPEKAAATTKTASAELDWTGVLDLTRARELSDGLKAALAAHDRVTITTYDVESADLAVVQILLAGVHTAKRDGKTIRLVDRTDDMQALWQEVGFGSVYQRLVDQDDESEVAS